MVGCGPGDPELLTLKGLRLIQNADIIIYDRLINNRVLAFAQPNTELIDVGKNSKSTGSCQDKINKLLIQKAKLGKKVIRLKGGDPFLFGRGGEEALFLKKEGVPFQIIPGVTSAIAAPAYAGIPVTHRNVSSSVTFVSGNEDPSKQRSAINWSAISNTGGTVVVLMGRGKLQSISTELINGGLKPTTPAALIRWGSEPHQKTITGNIQNIAEKADETSITPPVVLVVGKVVNLREELNWFEQLPLFGKRILVTRTRDQASKLSALLAKEGAIPLELPSIAIKPINIKMLQKQIKHVDKYSWIVFTSSNAVKIFFDTLYSLGLDSQHLNKSKFATIGPATTSSLNKHHILETLKPTTFNTRELGNLLVNEGMSNQTILLPRSESGHDEFVNRLRNSGGIVEDIKVYKTYIPERSKKTASDILKGGIDIATFTSSSTVYGLVSLLGGINELKNVTIACIGPVTEEAARQVGLKPDISVSESTVESMVKAVKEHFAR